MSKRISECLARRLHCTIDSSYRKVKQLRDNLLNDITRAFVPKKYNFHFIFSRSLFEGGKGEDDPGYKGQGGSRETCTDFFEKKTFLTYFTKENSFSDSFYC